MKEKFAPNNLEASRLLFTGRTKDIETILRLVLSGNCVALYGERRSGKTLTLLMIKHITNGDIQKYEKNLIDRTLKASISDWRNRLVNYTAAYVSLQGTRNEQELLNELLKETRRLKVFSSDAETPTRVINLLDELSRKLYLDNKRLLLLVDEMETLGDYKNDEGKAVAEAFCKIEKQERILFLHTGSYKWLERVSSPGSLFTHLEPHYLRGIDETEMINYLLAPLSSNDAKQSVARMSGSKPLYAQYIGREVFRAGRVLTQEDLLKNQSLCEHIGNNIYRERNLDDLSQKVLATLAHHPNSRSNWIAKRLGQNKAVLLNILNRLESFGTVSQDRGRYRLVGEVIETYGRETLGDPSRKGFGLQPKSTRQTYSLILRWAMLPVALALVLALYFYTHPPLYLVEGTPMSDIVARLDVPHSLESGERGTLNVAVLNRNDNPIDSLSLVFSSEHIQFQTKEGRSVIFFERILPGHEHSENIGYYVHSGDSDVLQSSISVLGQGRVKFDIKRRSLPLKRLSPLLYSILCLLGLLGPGKVWVLLTSTIRNILPSKKNE